MADGPIEREMKFSGRPSFEMPSFDSLAPGVRAITRETLDLDATYYDTADLRLVRDGISLRRRTGDGDPTWTLKLPVGHCDTMLERREFDVVSSSDSIPDELASLVAGWVRTASLEAVVDVLSRRERVVLVDETGADLVEIDDDQVRVREEGEIVARFREIEVELVDTGSVELMTSVAAALLAAGASAPNPMPKVARALGPRAAARSLLTETVPGQDASIAEVMAASIRSAVAEIISNDPIIRLDADPGAVHRARWAVRRLRGNLRVFARHAEAASNDRLRRELQWLSGELGALRRADVLLERVSSATANMAASDSLAAERLVARARGERDAGRHLAIRALSSDRYRELLETALSRSLVTRQESEISPAAVDVIPSIMERTWKRTRTAVRELSDEPTPDEVRAVRRQVLRLRSAAESAVPIFGAPAAEYAELAAAVQRDLGEYLDARECERWIRERLERLDGLEPFVAGQLVAAQGFAAEEALRRWIDSWRACNHRSAIAWFR
jgi:inorganic triphosphatase YgiF